MPDTTVPTALDAARRRAVRSLVAGVALGSTGHIAAVAVATIVAKDIAGTSVWAGAPGATVVLGAAVGSVVLASIMVRRGRRIGLTTGYLIGVIGALIAVAAVVARSMPLLLFGTLLIGFGNSSNQLSRYTAADMFPVARRASAIGIVVWGAAVGAVVGPNLVSFAGEIATVVGLPRLSGAYLLPLVFVGAAATLTFIFLRPDPYELADTTEPASDADGSTISLERVLRRPTVLAAIVALVAGQVVMVLIMTMTPLHMDEHGHDLAAVGLVISGHTFGMFALSPISGRLTDRFGSAPVIVAGLFVSGGAALMSAVAPAEGGVVLFVALFLLGYGWNMGFVAGSALLSSALELHERTKLGGITDALIWSSAAAASLSSGVVVAVASYTALGLIGLGVVVVPIVLVIRRRRLLAGTRTASA